MSDLHRVQWIIYSMTFLRSSCQDEEAAVCSQVRSSSPHGQKNYGGKKDSKSTHECSFIFKFSMLSQQLNLRIGFNLCSFLRRNPLQRNMFRVSKTGFFFFLSFTKYTGSCNFCREKHSLRCVLREACDVKEMSALTNRALTPFFPHLECPCFPLLLTDCKSRELKWVK